MVLLDLISEHHTVLASFDPWCFWLIFYIFHSEACQELLVLRVFNFVDLWMRHRDKKLESYTCVFFIMEVIAYHECLTSKSKLVLSSF